MRSIVLALIPVLFACRTTEPEAAQVKALGTSWEKVWSCENDSVVVDVNAGERRELQLVIRKTESFSFLDQHIPYGQQKFTGERIYSGRTSAGVFEPNQLVNFYRFEVASAGGSRPGVEIRRYGDTIVLRQLDFVKTACDSQVRHNDYSSCEVANFVFRNCRRI